MELKQVLEDMGFDQKEAAVYLSLLSSGESTATNLAQKTNLDRVLMYQVTKRLIEKGFASVIIKNNVRYFAAADPEVLVKQLKEKQEQLHAAMPELKMLTKSFVPESKVELYRGREGINTILRMIGRDAQPYFIMGGANEAMLLFEIENTRLLHQLEKSKVRGKVLARRKEDFFVGKNETYRYVPDHALSSTTMWMWGEKTAIFVWTTPYYAILIDNKEITRGNLATFQYLWETAEKPTKEDIRRRSEAHYFTTRS